MKVHFFDASLLDGKLWFASCDFNALFCYDLQSGKVEFVTRFEKYDKDKNSMFFRQIINKKQIIFLPYNKTEIVIYNTENNELKYTDIRNDDESPYDGNLYNGFLWTRQLNYPNQIKSINLDTLDLNTYSLDWNTIFQKSGIQQEKLDEERWKNNFFGSFYDHSGNIWLVPCEDPGFLLMYDISRQITQVIKVQGCENEIFSSITFGDDAVWIAVQNRPIVLKMNDRCEIIEKIEYDEKYADRDIVERIIYYKGKIVFLKMQSIRILDIQNRNMQCICLKNKIGYVNYQMVQNILYIFSPQCSKLIKFDIEEMALHEKDIEWTIELNVENFKKFYDNCLTETVIGLEDFLETISVNKECFNKTSHVGKDIWTYLNKSR